MATARADVAHLLRRAGFGGSLARINELATLDLPAIVDRLLDTSAANLNVRPPKLGDNTVGDFNQRIIMVDYWLDLCASTPAPLLEKMVLFWHGHVVVGADKVEDSEYLWRMNALQRQNAFGNWRTLIQAAAKQPSMMIYLDNRENFASSPNQNFARELLELFLLGVGNYTEGDVDATARAWSGHSLNDASRVYQFNPSVHDDGLKTFMGVTKNWDGPDIIDFLFDDPTVRQITASFLVRKLWAFFATPGAPDNVVADLSAIFIANNFEVKPVLRALFLRPEFYALNVKQGLVRTPIEWLVNIARQLGVAPSTLPYARDTLRNLGQEPFAPPNVSGWRPNRYWLSTAAASQRGDWAGSVGLDLSRRAGVLNNLTGTAVPQAVQAVFDRLGIDEPSQASRNALTTWLNEQRASKETVYEVRDLYQVALLLPELQLA